MLNEFLKIGEYEIAYDGVRLADHFVVRGADTSILPPITTNSIQIDGKPGAWFTGRNIGIREIVIRLGLISPTRKMIDALETWVTHSYVVGKDKPCRLDLGKGYWVNAILTGDSNIEKNGKWTIVSLTFQCFDPYIYRDSHTVDLKSGSNTVLVLGKAPTYPVFSVRSTSSSYIDIEDNTTKKKVRVYSPGTTNYLTVDMQAHKCTLGGAYKAADPSTTDFWMLNPGNQTINIKSGSGTMTYTEAYL